MTIFLDTTTDSDLGSYSGLLQTCARWLDRDDLTERVPDFIRLAEARFRRVIRNPQREVDLAISLSGTTPLPSGFDGARSLTCPDLLAPTIDQVTPEVFRERTRYAGERSVFAIIAGNIEIAPAPTTPISAKLIYNATIPALGIGNQSNWLLEDHPDIYLFATLLQAEFYNWNDERLPIMKGAVDEFLGELEEQGKRRRYGPGPLVARPPTYEPARGAYRR